MPGLRELAFCPRHGLLALSAAEQMVRRLIPHSLEGTRDTCHKGPGAHHRRGQDRDGRRP